MTTQVATELIADASVTGAKLATGAAAANLGAGDVTSTMLAASAVTNAKIANAGVSAAKLDGAQTGTAPVYGARAWVKFTGNGTNGTNQTILASGNVASVYKNTTGDYTITFTTAMPDANYVAVCNAQYTSSGGHQAGDNVFLIMANQSQTASALRVNTQIGNTNSGSDVVAGMVVVYR